MWRAVVLALILAACGPSKAATKSEEPVAEAGACPATFADAVGDDNGELCDEMQQVCQWPEGSCTCLPPPYCGPGAEPISKVPPSWRCEYAPGARPDGCPDDPPEGPCAEDGKVCSYDDGCCGEEVTCVEGEWTTTAGSMECGG